MVKSNNSSITAILPDMKNTDKEKPASYQKKRLPFHIIGLVCGAVFLFFLHTYIVKIKVSEAKHEAEMYAPDCESEITLIREKDRELVHPLVMVNFESESASLVPLKVNLQNIISQSNKRGVVTNTSVYLRELNSGKWMSINGDDVYRPGSLMKVAIMVYFLRKEQEHPGTLNTVLQFNMPRYHFPRQAYEGDSIIPGNHYKISELIRYMIVESDNYATHVLSQQVDALQLHKLFTDLQMPPDELNDTHYMISVKEFSKLLRVLYSATYVNEKLSEIGMKWLTEAKFKDGISKKLPSEIVVAHKFGERGVENKLDFSESGVVYLKNEPYLLTVMTSGHDIREQAELISELSNEVYKSMKEKE